MVVLEVKSSGLIIKFTEAINNNQVVFTIEVSYPLLKHPMAWCLQDHSVEILLVASLGMWHKGDILINMLQCPDLCWVSRNWFLLYFLF